MATVPVGCEALPAQCAASAPEGTSRPAGAARPAAPGRRLRAAEATETLIASAAGILDFEEFVDSLAFLSRDERNRFMLAGGEIFDNLIRHAEPLAAGSITVRCARRPHGGLMLAFYFKSPAFADFAACSSCGRTEERSAQAAEADGPEDEMAPFFDPLIGRWRGIGLRMCRNLSTSLLLRSGSQMDRIFIKL